MASLAFLGTGLLGSGMVERFLQQGHTVTVWNRTAAKTAPLATLGARVAESPEAAVAGVERVHMTLADDATVDPMVERIARHVPSGAWVIDHSTTSPAGTKARYARAEALGLRFAHAPVFMGPVNAREGTGLLLLSGPASLRAELEPLLAPMTGQVVFLGERVDAAATFKLFGNAMLVVIAGGLADVLAIARAQGIDPMTAVGLFSTFQVGNLIQGRGRKMAAGDYAASFELTMARKDVRLMLDAAGPEVLAALPGIAARMDQAIAAGRGRDDMGVLAAPDLPRT